MKVTKLITADELKNNDIKAPWIKFNFRNHLSSSLLTETNTLITFQHCLDLIWSCLCHRLTTQGSFSLIDIYNVPFLCSSKPWKSIINNKTKILSLLLCINLTKDETIQRVGWSNLCAKLEFLPKRPKLKVALLCSVVFGQLSVISYLRLQPMLLLHCLIKNCVEFAKEVEGNNYSVQTPITILRRLS